MRSTILTGLGLLASVAAAGPTVKPLNRRAAAPKYSPDPVKANVVKEIFQRGWDGYYKYAFPHDSLRPASNRRVDDRNGWGASAVDALSTAIMMDNAPVVKQILDFIPTIDFSTTFQEVSLFETTIRYLGGLISAYDLLTGPKADLAKGNEAGVKALLDQAVRLADILKIAFDTPSGIPDNSLFFDPDPRIAGSTTNFIATIGTLVLEWTRLSDITGNPEYGELTQRAEQHLLRPRPSWGEPFPGLIGMEVDVATGEFVSAFGGWVGGADSFFEYLIKMFLYDPKRFAEYRDRWVLAADSSIKHLASHPTTRPDLTFLAMYSDQKRIFSSQHLACFSGGNFILGGLLLNEQRYIDFGLELTASCRATYAATKTGIGPESWWWQDSVEPVTESSNQGPATEEEQEFYNRAGFWIDSSIYALRPETIESYYYAYRATGDEKYKEWAWDAILRINYTCAIGSGYSAITNVDEPRGGGFYDFQESFWFAEVLKYSYLIFAEDADFQVKADGTNKYVYNTEAHPVKIAPT